MQQSFEQVIPDPTSPVPAEPSVSAADAQATAAVARLTGHIRTLMHVLTIHVRSQIGLERLSTPELVYMKDFTADDAPYAVRFIVLGQAQPGLEPICSMHITTNTVGHISPVYEQRWGDVYWLGELYQSLHKIATNLPGAPQPPAM